MARKRSKRRIVLVICAVLRCLKRTRTAAAPQVQLALRRAGRIGSAIVPQVQAVLAVVVRVSGCAGTSAEVVTVHVALAALGAGALTLAAAFAGPAGSHLLKLAGAAGVSALALHAVFTVARQHQGLRPPLRPLLVGALARLPERHAHVPAARVLAVVFEPRHF